MKNGSVKVVLPLLLLVGCSSLGHQLRQLTGGVSARLADDVVIERDGWGVPHIDGRSDAAVAFGVAWAMAEDNFRELEEGYIQALGRSAYYYGRQYLADDLVRSAFQVESLARAEYAREPEAGKRLLQGFTHGLNYYLRKHPEQSPRVIARYEPWMILARVRTAAAAQHVEGVRLGDVAVLLGEPDAGSRPAPQVGPGAAWAVAPARSATGRALLLAAVEAPFFGSAVPYELELRSETGWQVHGLALLGTPIPFSGHNERLGWGTAAAARDSASAQRVLFDHPTDSLAYRTGNGWERAISWLDTVHVNTASGVEARTFRFLRTAAGPVITRRGDTAFVAHLPALEAGGSLQRWLGAGRARSLAEFTAQLAARPVPGIATAYADLEGNILADHADGRAPVVNPPSGEVRVGGGDAWEPSDSGRSTAELARLALGTMGVVPREEIAQLVQEWEQVGGRNSRRAFAMDTAVEMLRRWDGSGGRRAPAKPTAAGESGAIRTADAAEAGAVYAVDSAQAAAATLYQAWRETYRAGRAAARAAGDVGRAPAAGAGNTAGEAQDAYPSFRALEEVVAGLRRDWGTIQVPWTDLARLQRPRAGAEPAFDDEQASVALAGFPGGSLFVLHTGSGAGRRRYAVAGTAAVLVVEFTDPPRAASVVVFGQSADRTSPHYFDQAPLYAAGELKGVGFGAAAGEHGGAGSGVAGRRERYHPGARARVLRETPTR